MQDTKLALGIPELSFPCFPFTQCLVCIAYALTKIRTRNLKYAAGWS